MLLLLLACATNKQADEDSAAVQISWTDTDGDTIIDLQEGWIDPENPEGTPSTDTDGDGEADYLDLDSDGDALEDALEAGDADVITLPWDSDFDGTPDFRDLDSDENCLSDESEKAFDSDSDGIGSHADLDDDGDGIPDTAEMDGCERIDSDGDGIYDHRDTDADGDGIGDLFEGDISAYDSTPRDSDSDGVPDYLDDDSDNDGFPDADEGQAPADTEPPADTDADGDPDFRDIDADGDGINDADEAAYGTDPLLSDTDGDGFPDGMEVSAGTSPTDPGSTFEGLYVVVDERQTIEEHFDFELQLKMGDIGFLLDTTCSMSGALNSMASEFSQIVTDLSATVPDAEYAVATYDDYNYGGFGTSGDKPFILVQQVTSDTASVQSALSGLYVHNGVDIPESTLEGIYQSITGAGFDQDCNGRYDASTDVLPFQADPADPFGGTGGQFYRAGGAGGGTGGGMGFRDYALPVVVYVTDADFRDPGNGYGAPNGCPSVANSTRAANATTNLGAYLIGIGMNNVPIPQMNALAQDTASYADLNGDGRSNEELVFTWNSGQASQLRTTIIDAIDELVSSIRIEEVTLEIDGDTEGFVVAVDPPSHQINANANGQTIRFNLTFLGAVPEQPTPQFYHLTLNVIGDGTLLLGQQEIFVLIPGSAG